MIIANFEGNESVKYVSGLYQYDKEQILQITGLNLPRVVEIDFSLEETGATSKSCPAITKDGITEVMIPNEMLVNQDTDMNYNIYAFVYVTDASTSETVKRIVMQVRARTKPEQFEALGNRELFEKAINEVNNSADRAETAADTSEQNAKKTAEDRKTIEEMVETVSGIEQQVQDVKKYAGQAETAASNAALSEQKAKESETAALQAKADAETAKGSAETAAGKTAEDRTAVESAKEEVLQAKQQVSTDRAAVEAVERKVAQMGNAIPQAVLEGVQAVGSAGAAEKQGIVQAGTEQKSAVESAGTKAVEGINLAKKTATDAVETAKTDAVGAVGTAGAEQTQNVTAEGEKQVKAVTDKGAEVLQSIPEDFTTQMESKLNKQQGAENKGKALVVGEDGNVVVGEVQSSGNADIIKALQDALISKVVNGESINVTDSSGLPVEEFVMSGKTEQVQTTGANLFDISKAKVNLSELEAWGKEAFNSEFVMKTFKPNTEYYVKYKIKMIKAVTEKKLYDRSKSLLMYKAGGTAATIISEKKEMKDGEVITGSNIFTTPSDLQDYKILAYTERYTEEDGTGGFFSEIAIEELIISEQDVPYEPYTGGKPSPRPDYPQPIETTPQGIITVDFTDGTNHQIVELSCPREFTKWDRLEKIDGTWNWIFQSNKKIINEKTGFNINAPQQQEKDGIVFTTSFPDASGGNQTSLCDKFKNLNYVYGGSYKEKYGYYCDHVSVEQKYFRPPNETIQTLEQWKTWLTENPIEILYKTKVPELIPLSLSEQNKLNAITMYAPNTEITNTGGCNMELTYTVDTKSYVDAKILTLSKALL